MADKRGVLRPFRIDGKGDVVTGRGEALRESRVGLILATAGTSAGMLGEIPWDHRRGNKLEALRNGALGPVLYELAVIHCGETLSEVMPDEQLVGIDVTDDGSTLALVATTQRRSDRSVTPRTAKTTTTILERKR